MATENRGEAQQGSERQQGADRAAASGRSGGQGEARGERSTRGENERQASRPPGGEKRLARIEDFLSLLRMDPLSTAPFGLMRRIMQDMGQLLEDIGGFGRWSEGRGAVWSPQIEVFEQGGELVVRADLPGLEEKDVNVEIIDDTLVIEGERRSEIEETRRGLHRTERTYGRFRRAIPLREGVDTESANANFEKGVLEVRFKAPGGTERGRKIEVTSRREQSNEQRSPNVH
jgi:HSP20 family protein